MKIYKLFVQTHMYRFYFFSTKEAAEKALREARADDSEIVNEAYIEVMEFKATREGVSERLNDFISNTCMNEG